MSGMCAGELDVVDTGRQQRGSVGSEGVVVGDLAFRLSLPRTTTAARDARHDLGSWMPERCGPSVAETAMLLADELVANVVVHTRSTDLDVRASCDGVRLRVCVDDETPASPVPMRDGPEPPAGAGRGLWLVEALAASWGCEQLPSGKRIWFELPCAGGPGSAQG